MRHIGACMAALVFASGLAWAGADDRPEPDPRVREAMQKRQAGEQLTPEERQLLNQARRQFADRAGAQRGQGHDAFAKVRTGLIEYGRPGDLTVRQFAQFQLADLDLKADKVDDAIAKLEGVRNAAEDEARSLAAFDLGMIQLRKKGDLAKAKEYFLQVGGELSARARRMVVEPLLAQGKPAEAVEELKGFLAKATDAPVKAAVIHEMIQVLADTGNAELLGAFLRKVPDLISEEEASAAAKEEAKRFKENPHPPVFAPVGPGNRPGPGPGAMRKPGDEGPAGDPPPPPPEGKKPEAKELKRGLDEVHRAPDRDTALKLARELLAKAEKDGDEDAIQKIKKTIQRIESAKEWPPARPNKGAGKGGKKPGGGETDGPAEVF
jgi:tetratricopeptide (TPR) repeat protein